MTDQSNHCSKNTERVLQTIHAHNNVNRMVSLDSGLCLAKVNNQKPSRPVRQRISLNIENPYIKTGWDQKDEEELYRLHDEIGNKWAVLALRMPGRTDNCVKNHFYSKLRKAMRKLNKYIHDFYRRDFKQIKINAFYKIVEANQESHKPKTKIDPSVSDYCQKLKNRLLRFSDDDDLQLYEQKPEVKKMITEIVEFNRNYKRQIRRRRMNSGNEDWGKPEYRKNKVRTTEDIFSSSEDEDEEDLPKPTKAAAQTATKIQVNYIEPTIPCFKHSVSHIEMDKDESQGVESILINAGMMEDNGNMPMLFLKKDMSILSRLSGRPMSQNHIDHDAYFDESQHHYLGRGLAFHHFDHTHLENHHDFL